MSVRGYKFACRWGGKIDRKPAGSRIREGAGMGGALQPLKLSQESDMIPNYFHSEVQSDRIR